MKGYFCLDITAVLLAFWVCWWVLAVGVWFWLFFVGLFGFLLLFLWGFKNFLVLACQYFSHLGTVPQVLAALTEFSLPFFPIIINPRRTEHLNIFQSYFFYLNALRDKFFPLFALTSELLWKQWTA